ncbi:MAG: hypothetical protein CL749_06970, partial [Chloroflexi bacterium]|nr:hypothetical protein [Chloroflexota bacterium]
FAVLYAFEALMILFSGLPPGLTSSLEKQFPYGTKGAKQGAYIVIIIRPLVLGFLGWLFFFLARKKIQPKTSHQSSQPDEQLAILSEPLQPTSDSSDSTKKGISELKGYTLF